MAHQWETGFMVRKPSWHRLERAVLPDYVSDWDTARKEAGITWEYEAEPVYELNDAGETFAIDGWQKIVRDDKDESAERIMSIQQDSYALIKMSEFGSVIDACLGQGSESAPIKFEALMSLYGGRKIVALTYFDEPLALSWDPSQVYCYVAFSANFDGQGGITGIPTKVRVQCANTWRQAEETDGKRVGFTIRHTKNWEDRVDEVAAVIRAARKDNEAWAKLGEKLSMYKAGPRQREIFLKKFMPLADDMGGIQIRNVERSRDKIREILAGKSCDGIAGTGYGLVMAATEWSDHYRDHQSSDSYIGRQLLRKEAPKARAFRVVRQMAKTG